MHEKDKVFINICQSTGIPPPESITSEKLMELLQTDSETSYRVPMSISELRKVKHKEIEPTVCDVAVHPEFFHKVKELELFRDFLIQIIIEALDAKYNMQLDGARCTILRNKKQMGTLVKHRVQKRDIKTVYESYTDQGEETKKKISELEGGKSNGVQRGKPLIEEITPNNNNNLLQMTNNIEWRLVFTPPDNAGRKKILGEFYLPKVLSFDDIQLDIGLDRIVLLAPKYKYFLDGFLNYNVVLDETTATYNSDLSVSLKCKFNFLLCTNFLFQILTVSMPVSDWV